MLFLIALALLLVIDLPYLSLSHRAYASALPLNGDFVAGGALAYTAMAIACSLAVVPGKKLASAQRGAVAGALMYAVYNGTTMATHASYGPGLAVRDLLWGTLLCGTVSGVIA